MSSPIGLGHARRDVAIADELRRLHPDLEIDWLAQHPVTAVLEARGERDPPGERARWPASRRTSSRESAEHDLHCFQAMRRMDEILVANFMVFHDVVRDEPYDLWIGDEAWEVDYFLHENPELKTAAYAWLTDFVGWLPMPDGGEREACLTADYNAEMIEHIARYPRRARPRDLRRRPRRHRARHASGRACRRSATGPSSTIGFAGYVTGFDPAESPTARRSAPSSATAPDEQVCIVTVGGSGVGAPLLRRVIAALPRGQAAGPRPAHGRRRRAAHRPGVAARRRRARGARPTCPTCTGTWPPATSRSCRAG